MYPFREGSFAPLNGWYVAAFCHEIKRELLSRWILNQPVVMYRTESGEPVALDGRCPHRHFPLGKSCLKGDEIQCGYHGIRFGSDGQCTNIPSQEHTPQRYRVRKYPVVEHGMWLFIWPGDPDKADPGLLPDLELYNWSDPDFDFEPFYALEIRGRYQLLNDNLLDLTHLAYLHEATIGVEQAAAEKEVREEFENYMTSRRFMKGVPIMPVQQGTLGYEGLVDRVSGMDFHLPGFHAGIDEMTIPEDHPERSGERLTAYRPFHAVTPGKRDTAHYFFAVGGVVADGELDQMKEYLKPVINEDVMATEEIEAMLSTLGNAPEELIVKSDAGAVQARRRLQAMMDRESGWAALA